MQHVTLVTVSFIAHIDNQCLDSESQLLVLVLAVPWANIN